MIREYALDPFVVAEWHDRQKWAFYREAFRQDTGRIVSRYPRKWTRQVIKAFHEKYPGFAAESQARRQLEIVLDYLGCSPMAERELRQDAFPTWIEKVLAEHEYQAFDGIITTKGIDGRPEIMTEEMLFEHPPPDAWSPPSNSPRLRNADEFAGALNPLLSRCREVVFVDPHFDPGAERFIRPLELMLEKLWSPNRHDRPSLAKLVTGASRDDARKGRSGDFVLNKCKERLPRILPKGRKIDLLILVEREKGEKLHNRYVLTLLGGVSFGIGLDVADQNGKLCLQTDDLCRLTSEQLKMRWKQYVSGCGSYFDIYYQGSIGN